MASIFVHPSPCCHLALSAYVKQHFLVQRSDVRHLETLQGPKRILVHSVSLRWLSPDLLWRLLHDQSKKAFESERRQLAQTTTTKRTIRYGAGNAELQAPALTIRPLGSSAPSVDFNALCTRAARSSQWCSKSDSVVGVRFVLPERIVIARLTRALIVSNGNLPQCKLPLAPTFIYLP